MIEDNCPVDLIGRIRTFMERLAQAQQSPAYVNPVRVVYRSNRNVIEMLGKAKCPWLASATKRENNVWQTCRPVDKYSV
jgi:hypothetical protein